MFLPYLQWSRGWQDCLQIFHLSPVCASIVGQHCSDRSGAARHRKTTTKNGQITQDLAEDKRGAGQDFGSDDVAEEAAWVAAEDCQSKAGQGGQAGGEGHVFAAQHVVGQRGRTDRQGGDDQRQVDALRRDPQR